MKAKDYLEHMFDSRARDRQEIYKIICETEKDSENDFSGTIKMREFLMLYLEGFVPFDVFFTKDGSPRTKNELCLSIKKLRRVSLNKTFNDTGKSIWNRAFGSSLGFFTDSIVAKGATNVLSGGSSNIDEIFTVTLPLALLVGAVSAVITTGVIGIRGTYRRIVSRAKKAMTKAQSELNKLESQIILQKPHLDFKAAGITTIDEVRVEISKNPKYSIFLLVKPNGVLRTSITEVEKAYGVYVESLI